MTAEGNVEIGRIAKAHGLAGEVGVKLHWSESEALFDVAEIVLRKGDATRTLAIERLRPTPKGLLVKLEGVDDRDAAEALVGASVSVPRSALPAPAEGEYYLGDLVGLKVVGPNGEVGVIAEVRVNPSVDSAIISSADGRTLELPLVDRWLEEVDLEARVLTITSTDALMD